MLLNNNNCFIWTVHTKYLRLCDSLLFKVQTIFMLKSKAYMSFFFLFFFIIPRRSHFLTLSLRTISYAYFLLSAILRLHNIYAFVKLCNLIGYDSFITSLLAFFFSFLVAKTFFFLFHIFFQPPVTNVRAPSTTKVANMDRSLFSHLGI